MESPSGESDDEAADSLRGRATYKPGEHGGVASRFIGGGIHIEGELMLPSTFNMGTPHKNPVSGVEAYTMICPVLYALGSLCEITFQPMNW